MSACVKAVALVSIRGMSYPIIVAVAGESALLVLALAGLSANSDAMVKATGGEGVAFGEVPVVD